MNKDQRKEVFIEAVTKMKENPLLDFDEFHPGEFESKQDEYIEDACKRRGWTLQDFYATTSKELDNLFNIHINKPLMQKKTWYKVTLSTEEQTIEIRPAETFKGITLEIKELDDNIESSKMSLNVNEMEFLITKMREMMKHVQE